MRNVSVLLIGGALDGQTYTAREDETTLQIHDSETDELPGGKFYSYKQESEGSDRFVFLEE